MDTERMKRVLERVYGPAAPTEEKKTPDALRESIRLEAEAAARLRYLMRTLCRGVPCRGDCRGASARALDEVMP